MRDSLWAFAQKYVTFYDVSADVKIGNGLQMRISSAPRVEQEIFLFGEWEPLFTRYIAEKEKSDGIFIDLGANIGYFSLIASQKFAEVHAVEASPDTAARLRSNLAANGLENVVVHCVAVGPESGTTRFFRDERQSGGSSVFAGDGKVFEADVPVEPLEKILDGLAWSRVRFVKIDVEGSEAAVLASLIRLADQLSPEIEIFVEFDPARDQTWPQITRFLALGFNAYMLQGPYDREDYLDRSRRTLMQPLTGKPELFCDILLRRGADPGSRGGDRADRPDPSQSGKQS